MDAEYLQIFIVPASISHAQYSASVMRYFKVLAVHFCTFYTKSSTLDPAVFNDAMYRSSRIAAFMSGTEAQEIFARTRH